MTHVKNTINGLTGVSMAAATIVTQISLHAQPIIALLAGIGGLIVICMTIVVSYKTARRTDAETATNTLEQEKLRAEIERLREEE